MTLTFVDGIISGMGRDAVGIFGIAGCVNMEEGEICWTKTYFGEHRVHYRGFIDGAAIWGTWEIPGCRKGGFHIWPSIESSHRIAYGVKTLRSPARSSVRR